MILVFSFFFIGASTQYTFDYPGFHGKISTKASDSLFFNLQSKYSAIIFWLSYPSDLSYDILLCNATFSVLRKNINEKALLIDGENATISINSTTQAAIWIIPKYLCSETIIYYRTNDEIYNSFSTSKDIPNLCIFFPDHYYESTFLLSIISEDSIINVKAFNSSISERIPSCDKTSCHFNSISPFFIQFEQIKPTDSIYIRYKMAKKLATFICSHGFTSHLYNNSISYSSVKMEKISCDLSFNSKNNQTHFLLITLIDCLIAFGLIIFIYILFKNQTQRDLPFQTIDQDQDPDNIALVNISKGQKSTNCHDEECLINSEE